MLTMLSATTLFSCAISTHDKYDDTDLLGLLLRGDPIERKIYYYDDLLLEMPELPDYLLVRGDKGNCDPKWCYSCWAGSDGPDVDGYYKLERTCAACGGETLSNADRRLTKRCLEQHLIGELATEVISFLCKCQELTKITYRYCPTKLDQEYDPFNKTQQVIEIEMTLSEMIEYWTLSKAHVKECPGKDTKIYANAQRISEKGYRKRHRRQELACDFRKEQTIKLSVQNGLDLQRRNPHHKLTVTMSTEQQMNEYQKITEQLADLESRKYLILESLRSLKLKSNTAQKYMLKQFKRLKHQLIQKLRDHGASLGLTLDSEAN